MDKKTPRVCLGVDAGPNWNGSEDYHEPTCIEPLPALMKNQYRYNGRPSARLTGNKKPEGSSFSGCCWGHSRQRSADIRAEV